jgi:hypothetical protein
MNPAPGPVVALVLGSEGDETGLLGTQALHPTLTQNLGRVHSSGNRGTQLNVSGRHEHRTPAPCHGMAGKSRCCGNHVWK